MRLRPQVAARMVVLAQLVEHRIVVPSVVGSSPTFHPKERVEMALSSCVWGRLTPRPWVLISLCSNDYCLRQFSSPHKVISVDVRALKPRFLLVTLAVIGALRCAPSRCSVDRRKAPCEPLYSGPKRNECFA